MDNVLPEAPVHEFAAGWTAREEIDIPEGYELVDGELMEKNVSFLSNLVGARIITALENHANSVKAGTVLSEGVTYKCFPDFPQKSRRADASFIRMERLTRKQALARGSTTFAPDLVVEVVSPNDTYYEVDEKREEWLNAGVSLVWIVNPEVREVIAYRRDAAPLHFRNGDALTAEPVLPGFRTALDPLFELPGDGVT